MSCIYEQRRRPLALDLLHFHAPPIRISNWLTRPLRYGTRSQAVTAKAAQAYERLLTLAEQRDSGQIKRVAQFIAATYNGQDFPFDLFELRCVDIDISDDMLLCLDALRWARLDLYGLVPDGDRRIRAMLDQWGLIKQPED